MNNPPSSLISYAQNYEDVRVLKALRDRGPRTYVDIGAGHPDIDSVTRLLMDHGWSGLNVEPGEHHDLLAANRPADVTVRIAITCEDGTARFAKVSPHAELSSLASELRIDANSPISTVDIVDVESMRLDTLLSEHWDRGEIGLLKIDVEGAESAVIESNDWTRFRPWVVVVEAIRPVSHEPSHEVWEPVLLAAGYVFAHFDGVNRFYARDDHPEVAASLAQPVSAADYVVRFDLLSARERATHLEAVIGALEEAQREAGLSAADFRRSVAEREARTLGRLSSLDRESKEAQMRASRATALLAEHDAHLTGARVHIAALESEIAALRRSRVVRVGFLLHRVVLPARPVMAVVAPLVRRLRRRRLSSARRMRDVYARRTAPGLPLETVRSGRTVRPIFESGLAVSELHGRLRNSRSDHARLLDPSEVAQIESTLAAQRRRDALDVRAGDELLTLAVALARTPRGTQPAEAQSNFRRDLVLVDGRALQTERRTGIGRHARAVLDRVIAQLPAGTGVALLPCHVMKPLDPQDAALATEPWDPTKLGRVAVYLQLVPFVNASDDGDLEILLDPSIRKVTVFLDDIQGMHPRYFLTNEWDFWFYQLGVERLRFADALLVLSESSANEARVMFDGVADAPDIVVSGAVDGVSSPGLPPPAVAALDDFVVAVGNPIVHKNLALAVAGLSRLCGAPNGPGLVVMSSSTPDMVSAIVAMALELGVPPARVVVTGSIPDAQLAATLRDARVVVIPSHHEGFSLPVVEALDAGTPVAVSRIGAHRELLGDGEWMFDPTDPVDLARAVGSVLSHPDRTLSEQRSALALRYRPELLGEAVARALGPIVFVTPDADEPPAFDARMSQVVKPSGVSRSMLSLCKVCELEDFADHRLRMVMRDVFSHEVVRFGESFPDGKEYRKYWEIAMAVLAFKQTGHLRRESTILGIGAGNEATCFYLTRHAGRVIATDLYESPGWQESASTSMMTNPEWHWPFLWEPERLEVRHMDALELDLPDCSVDGIFSSSSVEHFGSHEAVGRSLDEAHRVLKPGGVLSVSTEFRLFGPPPGIPGALMFDLDDVDSLFIGGRTWDLIDPFDHRVSEGTIATASSFRDQLENQLEVIDRYGGLFTHITEYARYPHIALHVGTRMFTSMHIALRKRA